MDKATPTPSPASYDFVMSLYKEVVEALMYDTDAVADAENNFRAEVERLAAQAAPTLLDALKSGKAILIDWPMEPSTPEEALELMDAMDAEYAKTMGKPAPDDEMAVAMRRVRHMACDLWAWQKEAMRANFTALAAAQPSQAPVVQAGEYPPLPEPKVARVRCDDCEGSGFLRVSPDPERSDEVCSACRGRGWSSETLVHVEDDIRAFADATCAMRASAGDTPAVALTGGEIKALTAMVWGAPCSGRDLAIVTSTVRAMEALGPGERPIDPADGGRLLDVDACIVEPAAGLATEGQTP